MGTRRSLQEGLGLKNMIAILRKIMRDVGKPPLVGKGMVVHQFTSFILFVFSILMIGTQFARLRGSLSLHSTVKSVRIR